MNLKIILLVFLFTTIYVIGFVTGGCIENNSFKLQAVKLGVAEYYLDDEYNKQFRWKLPVPVPE